MSLDRQRQRLVALVVIVGGIALMIGRAFGGGCPAPGSCLAAHANAGCENVECCELVCSADPFCCQVQWDQVCASEGQEWCAGGCGGPLAGDCLQPHATPACADTWCCEDVCAADSYCCEVEWDEICADEGYQICVASCGGALAGDCLQPHADPACWEPDCCDAICSADPYCCDAEWDATCASAAFDTCTACGGASAGSCYAEHGPNCDDENCCAGVCTLDSYCCLVEWDATCVGEAEAICALCGGFGSGSCFTLHGPGCDDQACCITICALDMFCCDGEWDSLCVQAAIDVCPACGNPGAGACLAAHPTPFCDDADCCGAVCSFDSYCCETEWDDLCVTEAAETCGGCGASEAPSCLLPHASSGCDLVECCATVCGNDPFCCDVAWDQVCVLLAQSGCVFPSCYGLCAGDLNMDGQVNGQDLALLLGAWGSSQCADLDGSGTVNGPDLAQVLGSWGPCGP